jgi:hypothetical protein
MRTSEKLWMKPGFNQSGHGWKWRNTFGRTAAKVLPERERGKNRLCPVARLVSSPAHRNSCGKDRTPSYASHEFKICSSDVRRSPQWLSSFWSNVHHYHQSVDVRLSRAVGHPIGSRFGEPVRHKFQVQRSFFLAQCQMGASLSTSPVVCWRGSLGPKASDTRVKPAWVGGS